MRWLAMLLVCAVAGSTFAGGDAANKKLIDALQGEWKMQKMVRGGKPAPDEKVMGTALIIKGEQVAVREADKEPKEHAKIVVDTSKKPTTIDIIPEGKADRAVHGIVSLDGDTLRICFARPGQERPKAFDSKEGSMDTIMELKRVKK